MYHCWVSARLPVSLVGKMSPGIPYSPFRLSMTFALLFVALSFPPHYRISFFHLLICTFLCLEARPSTINIQCYRANIMHKSDHPIWTDTSRTTQRYLSRRYNNISGYMWSLSRGLFSKDSTSSFAGGWVVLAWGDGKCIAQRVISLTVFL